MGKDDKIKTEILSANTISYRKFLIRRQILTSLGIVVLFIIIAAAIIAIQTIRTRYLNS